MKGLTIRIGERTLLEPLDYTVPPRRQARHCRTQRHGQIDAFAGAGRQAPPLRRHGAPGFRDQGGRLYPAAGAPRRPRHRRDLEPVPALYRARSPQPPGRFGYRGEEVFKDCATLSGGEAARLRFAELALERPNLMFLDEPTNHLDIYMRESLTQALAAYTGTLLLVTHDRYLMQTLGCPILYLEDGKATLYRDFAALHAQDTAPAAPRAAAPRKPRRAAATARSSAAAVPSCAPASKRWRTRSRTSARTSLNWKTN